MVGAFDFGSSGVSSRCGLGHCVVFSPCPYPPVTGTMLGVASDFV